MESRNNSVVNRLYDRIQIYKFDFKKRQLGEFDYKMLMRNKSKELTESDRELIKEYTKIARNMRQFDISIDSDRNAYAPLLKQFKETLGKYGNDYYITDVLVKYLFDECKARRKTVFWNCYGQTALENIRNNLDTSKRICKHCGCRFVPTSPGNTICPECSAAGKQPEIVKKCTCLTCGADFVPTSLCDTRCPVCTWMMANPVTTDKTSFCIDCGAEFDVPRGRGRKQTLCKRCQDLHRKAKHIRYVTRIRK